VSGVLQAAEAVAGFVPVAGPAISVALQVADAMGAGSWLSKHILGQKGSDVAQAVVAAAQAAIGTQDVTPAAIAALPPDKRADLQVQLAGIAAQREAAELSAQTAAEQARLDEIKAAMADTEGARSSMTALAQAHSPLAYAPLIISLVALGFWGAKLLGIGPTLDGAEDEILKVAVTLVLGYWLGSSARQPATDLALANSVPVNAVSQLSTQGGGAAASRPFGR
jgi:hypothetical protein